ncbi:PNK3P-domain-containing protein [Hesseltinella vesiculosa]|uniref:PNK3P-domain-containing protein n=1 Tax=Hesseltinella vesiculosa TaxID=101127 RepID=A0A1X2G7L6_9FUNG|nr:PNK3P-domain-containing protein [Hesseltinella vesiculosa]
MKTAVKWISGIESLLVAASHGKEAGRTKVAAFDLDGTLIKTKSGAQFAKNSADWMWWDVTIPEKLQDLHSQGYKIVIFSNQNGLHSSARVEDFKRKANHIMTKILVPVYLFAAKEKDHYRKPMTGMWDYMLRESNGGVAVDIKQSFYVGDAAGRAAGWKPRMKKDHSCVDRKYADNLGLPFHTPEAYFTNEAEAAFSWGEFDPRAYTAPASIFTPESTPLIPDNRPVELIILVGPPASGKSTFAKNHLKEYTWINQDALKTKQKCLKGCAEALTAKKPVVIDNTNGILAVRKEYISLAKSLHVPVRCFYFTASQGLCQHNNHYRALQLGERSLLSRVVFNTYNSRFESPTLGEGFDEIKHIHFSFDGTEGELATWKKWHN